MNSFSQNRPSAPAGGFEQTCEQMFKSMPDLVVTASLQIFAANMFHNCRGYVATHALAALLNSPNYNPTRQEDGETSEQAYARRACDFADALLSELHRRQANAHGETHHNPLPALSRDAATKQSL